VTPVRILVMGVSGCGKSRFGAALATATGLVFRDADDLHPEANIAKMTRGEPLSDDDRWPWLEACGVALEPGGVLACSALRRAYRNRLRDFAPDLRVIHLAASEAEISGHLQARQGHFMPPALLASQCATLEPPGAEEGALALRAFRPVGQMVAEARNWLKL
jgi:carbohydrate kinase (thermoresistant glucokinase family)